MNPRDRLSIYDFTREAVIGSHTAPVEEVIADGVNGELVDFFDTDALSERICAALQDPAAGTGIRQAARRLILEHYELNDCLAQQVALMERLMLMGKGAGPPEWTRERVRYGLWQMMFATARRAASFGRPGLRA